MAQRIFPQDHVEHTEGHWVRAYRIQCGNPSCMEIEKVSINTSGSSGGDDSDQLNRRAQRKFEEQGWKIGKRDKDDRCPLCVNSSATVIPMPPPAESSVRADLLQTTAPAPLPPYATQDDNAFLKPKSGAGQLAHGGRAITREDKRAIAAKLEDVWSNQEHGYQSGWSDNRVAKDMRCPIGWVADVRDDMFGPVGESPELRAIMAEAQEVFTAMKETRAEVQRNIGAAELLWSDIKKGQSDIQRLGARADGLEKKIQELAKQGR